jgi:hypothetical protein
LQEWWKKGEEMHKIEHIDQKIFSRFSSPIGGVDYGSEGKIIAEIQTGKNLFKRLVWFKGYSSASSGVRGFGQDYSPSRLSFIEEDGLTIHVITEGGRLSKSRVKDHSKEIEKLAGNQITDLIDIKKTLIVI